MSEIVVDPIPVEATVLAVFAFILAGVALRATVGIVARVLSRPGRGAARATEGG